MTLTICYKKGLQFRGVSHFLPFLKTIERYPFPKPLNCSRTSVKLTWLKTTIVSFTSKKFLSYLDSWKGSMHWIQVDSNDATRIHLAINQTGENVIVLSNLSAFIHPAQIKQLFVDLIMDGRYLDHGLCGKNLVEILEKNLPHFDSRQMTFLNWLQYFGKAELERRGGIAAFESNPYLQTERIHDGLFVQVGDDPSIFDTPEGEQLLVNAINALPLIQP